MLVKVPRDGEPHESLSIRESEKFAQLRVCDDISSIDRVHQVLFSEIRPDFGGQILTVDFLHAAQKTSELRRAFIHEKETAGGLSLFLLLSKLIH